MKSGRINHQNRRNIVLDYISCAGRAKADEQQNQIFGFGFGCHRARCGITIPIIHSDCGITFVKSSHFRLHAALSGHTESHAHNYYHRNPDHIARFFVLENMYLSGTAPVYDQTTIPISTNHILVYFYQLQNGLSFCNSEVQ
jgi:hypothetical protein